MSRIELTTCDGPGCKNRIDHSEPFGNPTFNKLFIGGSDFDMSFIGGQKEFDFCSIVCLHNFIVREYADDFDSKGTDE